MIKTACPIVDGCLRLAVESADERQLEEIRHLTWLGHALPGDHGHICFRGFLTIQAMLDVVAGVHASYKRQFDRPMSFELSSRSWEGLTQMKVRLGDLLDEVHLNDADTTLRGPSHDNFGDIVYAVRLNRMKTTAELVLNQIKLFRPYLRNPKVPVHRLAAGISVLYGWIYPTEYVQKMLWLTKNLMQARL